MINKVLTVAEIRKDLVEFLEGRNMTIEQFIAMDIDDIDDIFIRDVKLMVMDLDLNKGGE
jgi:hypothetical protein